MPDRTIRYGLELDSRQYIAGVKGAEQALADAKRRANQLNQEQLVLQARGAQLSKALQSKITNDEWVEVVKRGGQNRKMLAENVAAQQKAAKDIATAQKNLTREIDRESKKQQAAQRAGVRGALQAGVRGAAQGAGIPLPVAGVGAAAGAGLAIGLTAKKAVGDVIELATSIRNLQMILGGTTEDVSAFIAVGQQFGVTDDQMADAARNLASAIVTNPEQLHALGVATEDAAGKSRPLIDVMGDVRRVLSEGKADANTFRIAQELLGRSVGNLIPWLRASEQQIDAAAAAARRAGLVMSREAVEGALSYKASLDSMGRSVNGVVLQLGQRLIPMLANVAEAAMVAGDMIGSMLERSSNPLKDVPVIGGITNLLGNAADIAQGKVNDDTARIARAVESGARVRAEFNKLMAAGVFEGGGGKDLSGLDRGSLAGGANDAARAAADAIREQMDARRDAAAEWIEALRENLDAYQKEHDAAIRFIQDEQRAHAEAHQARIEQIQDEQKALEEAFRVRDQARSDEIAAIRDQISATDALYDAEKARQDLAEAEADLAHESTVQIFRERNETEEQYQRRVFNQQERIKDATKKVEDEKTAIARAAIRAELDARIKALEVEADLERRSLDDKKRAAEIIMESIRDEMAAEKEKADERIQQLRDEQQAERDRVSDHIKEIEHETKSILKELEDRLKAIQTHSAGVVAAYGAQTIAANVAEQAARNAAAAQSGGYGAASGAVGPVGPVGPGGTVTSPPPGGGGAVGIGGGTSGGGGFDMPVNDYPHTMTFARPTLMVDMASGAAIGAAAVSGPEPVTFHGVGTRSGPGGGVASTVNVYGLGLDEASRLIAARVDRNLERRARGRTAAGFGRR